MRVALSVEAAADVDEIDDYYRAEAGSSTASQFVDQLDSALELISMFPVGAQAVSDRPGVHRLGLARFPYYVFYEIIQHEVVVLRVLHTARSSDAWP